MSEGTDLKVASGIELSRQMKEAIREFAQREEHLLRELRTRKNAESRTYREGMASAEHRLATRIPEIEAHFDAAEETARTRHATRLARIERAQRTGADSLLQQARRTKERWMEKLQMRHFDATKSEPFDLKAAESAFTKMAGNLAREHITLVSLQRRVRGAFLGYLSFLAFLRKRNATEEGKGFGFATLAGNLAEQLQNVDALLREFRRFVIPFIFSFLPVYITVPVVLASGAYFVFLDQNFHFPANLCYAVAGGVSIALLVLHFFGGNKAAPTARALSESLAEAERIYDACASALRMEYDTEYERIKKHYRDLFAEIEEKWARSDQVENDFIEARKNKTEHQAPRLLEKNENQFKSRMEGFHTDRIAQLAQINSDVAAHRQQIEETHKEVIAQLDTDEATQWAELDNEWKNHILPLYRNIADMNAAVEKYAPPWSVDFLEKWEPPLTFPPAVKFASLNLDLASLMVKPVTETARFVLPGPSQVSIPLALNFPDQGSLLFETSDSGEASVIDTLNNIILRILTTAPPGKISFTILDPVGLGRNFAGLMHLADFEESLISRRIWTQQDQIEERLAELNEHIEKVIQMYLRNEYANITEYNAQAGSVAEKYHFLVVADFPANFSETAVKRLQSIIASGPRCGVFTLIHWDRRVPEPDGIVADELKRGSVALRRQMEKWVFSQGQPPSEAVLVFDKPPESALAVRIVHQIGESSIDSNRVEVPFSQIMPAKMWDEESTSELRVAVGRTGATKLQYLALGKGTKQHALFAGKTGSGKSTLFHVIITNLALTYSPDEVEFYLIDFKKGVEFKCYATSRLPHARVVAIESDREFGLSVLQRVDEELKRRGDLFRKLGVQDIPGYKRSGGTEPMPRSLLIIDEFQEFFVQDDQISQTASLLFDRIVRQGRAFGIHVLLGSQTLGGAYTLARATLGQMVVRVALQCNEADAYLIMDDNNPAPRLLSRPGEGIYNDMAGAPEGNSPFQVVWLPDEEREERLEDIRRHGVETGDTHRGPIVFEGNAPADIRENTLLQTVLENTPTSPLPVARVWLGAPNSIKGPTEAAFQKQTGNNLLLVGQRDEAVTTILSASLLALAAQYPVGSAKFYLIHAGIPGAPDLLDKAAAAIPHGVTIVQNNNLGEAISRISAELKARSGGEAPPDAPDIYLFISGLQKFKKLRNEDDFSFSSDPDAEVAAGAQLATLLSEGGSYGIHTIVSVDTFNNVNRFLSRKALSEFEMRVVFQMSANDSASLIDSPLASNLGLHRAIYYNEHNGHTETFRPYALPDPEWLENATRQLAQIHA